MSVRAISLTVALLVVGCCLLVAGCDSLDKSADDTSTTVSTAPVEVTTTEAPSTTVPARLDDALVGLWNQLEPPDANTFEFFADGRVSVSVWDVEADQPVASEYTYRVEGDQLIFTNAQGVDEATSTYHVQGKTLTIVDPESDVVYTFVLLDPDNSAARLDDALLETWLASEPADGTILEFFADGSLLHRSWDAEAQETGESEYTWRTEGDHLVLTNTEGVDEADVVYQIQGDTLAVIDDDGSVYTFRSGEAVELALSILGRWGPVGEEDSPEGFQFFPDWTAWQTVWNPETQGYNIFTYTFRIEGGVLTFVNEQGLDEAPSTITVQNGLLMMTNQTSGETATFQAM